MARMAAFRFTVVEDSVVRAAVVRHVGARRFAYNRCLRAVKDALDERRVRPGTEVPWTGFSLINWWNAWKRSEEAGRVFCVDGSGGAELVATGLAWRDEVCAQVFEEAAVDLGRALAGVQAWRRGTRKGPKVGFPRFCKRGKGPESFRLRNKVSVSGRSSIRVGEGGARSVTLPVLGVVQVREDTRRLRRLLRPRTDGTFAGRICSATIALRQERIQLTLTCEVPDLHPGLRHAPTASPVFVGVDRGLSSLVVAAGADRTEHARIAAPRHLTRSLLALRRASRRASRRRPGSANRKKADARLARLHATISNRRRDFTHRTSTSLAKTHGGLCIEDLAVSNLARNRHLARAVMDAAWGELGTQLRYKAHWYGATLLVAPRFFASTKTCSGCGWVWEDMGLKDRVFSCTRCGLVCDRDTNAAANLAAWGEAEHASATRVPDPDARGRVTKACRERSAGRHLGDGGTALGTPDPGRTQEPSTAAPAA